MKPQPTRRTPVDRGRPARSWEAAAGARCGCRARVGKRRALRSPHDAGGRRLPRHWRAVRSKQAMASTRVRRPARWRGLGGRSRGLRSRQETPMRTPLLETKLYRPGPRPGLVPRPRLIERLDRGAASKLMLVSAPAGFGKTTLLAEWLAGTSASAGERSAAWLSLDPGDNDPVTFWTYVIAALRTVAPGVGASELALLPSPQPPPIQMVLTTLLNDLGGDRQRHRAGARRLPPDRLPRDPGRDGVPARPPASAAAPGDRQPRRPARCRWPGCGRAASWSRSVRPTCGSRRTRLRRTSTG